jgi:hypothetical protein
MELTKVKAKEVYHSFAEVFSVGIEPIVVCGMRFERGR